MKKTLSLILVLLQIIFCSVFISSADITDFSDVKKGRWSKTYIDYAVENGYMVGVSENKFDPSGKMTRAMVVTVLFRASGSPNTAEIAVFKDVKKSSWYYDSVLWAYENGVVNGTGNGCFSPDDYVTREQLAAFIYRYADSVDGKYMTLYSTSLVFRDRKAISSYAKNAVCWCYINKIIEGTDKYHFNPKDTATREMFAAVIYRYCNNGIRNSSEIIKLPEINIISDTRYQLLMKDKYSDIHISFKSAELFPQTEYDGEAQLKIRGNSTSFAAKSPFKLKLSEKVSLFGMEKNKHWVLLSNPYDYSNMRNYVSYYLGGRLGMPSMDSVPVHLFYNGDYYGLYQLCEHVRVGKGRIDIFDWENEAENVADSIAEKENMSKDEKKSLENRMTEDLSWITSGVFDNYCISDYYDTSFWDITGGYLIENDNNMDEISCFLTENEMSFMIQSPEYLKTNDAMFSFVRDYIQEIEDAVYSPVRLSKNGIHYSEYMDMNSFLAFWTVTQLFRNEEYLNKSCYLYKDVGEKLKWGPIWDMDYSSGNPLTVGKSQSYTSWGDADNYWSGSLCSDPWFIVCLYDYWNSHQTEIDDMFSYFDSMSDLLRDGIMDDSLRWKYTPYSDISILKNWLVNRRNWMNRQFSNPDSLLKSFDFFDKSDSINVNLISEDEEKLTFSLDLNNDCLKQYSVLLNGELIISGSELENGTEFSVYKSILREEGMYNSINVVPADSDGSFIESDNKYPLNYIGSYYFYRSK